MFLPTVNHNPVHATVLINAIQYSAQGWGGDTAVTLISTCHLRLTATDEDACLKGIHMIY